jgi:translation initiation factor IF-1
MVRNTNGGSKTKSCARKSIQPTASVVDYSPKDDLEKIAVVSKLYGNGMCQVLTTDSPQLDLMCHIRGKFRGRSKKHNMLSVNSRIVIGLREWENPYKNADLISVLSTYEDSTVQTGNSKNPSNTDSFVFSNEDVDETLDVLPQKNPDSSNVKYEDEIDIDDI